MTTLELHIPDAQLSYASALWAAFRLRQRGEFVEVFWEPKLERWLVWWFVRPLRLPP